MNSDYQNVKHQHKFIEISAEREKQHKWPLNEGDQETIGLDAKDMLEKYEQSFFFDLSTELTTVLDKTNYSNADRELLKPPFDNIILNIDRSFKGPMIEEDLVKQRVGNNYAPWILEEKNWEITSIYIQRLTKEQKKQHGIDPEKEIFALFTILKDPDTGQPRDLYEVTGIGDESWEEPTTVNQYISNIVTNFLLFMNQSEVEYRVRERTDKNRERRRDKGKTPLPNDAKVEVSGEIKLYLDKVQETDTDIEHEHRYWVRGHWRTLRDEDHWGDKAGEKVWVKPHIRGEGPLIDKEYELKS